MINVDAIRLLEWYYSKLPNPEAFLFCGDESDYFAHIAEYRFLRSTLLPKTTGTLNVAHTMDPRFLAEQLGYSTGLNYFDFATRVLNLLDEESFPCYNSHIVAIFDKPFSVPDENDLDFPGKQTLNYQESVYQDILDTYHELENHPIIEAFRSRFNCPDFSYMKILDLIFQEIGKLLERDGLEPTPAEFLKEHGR